MNRIVLSLVVAFLALASVSAKKAQSEPGTGAQGGTQYVGTHSAGGPVTFVIVPGTPFRLLNDILILRIPCPQMPNWANGFKWDSQRALGYRLVSRSSQTGFDQLVAEWVSAYSYFGFSTTEVEESLRADHPVVYLEMQVLRSGLLVGLFQFKEDDGRSHCKTPRIYFTAAPPGMVAPAPVHGFALPSTPPPAPPAPQVTEAPAPVPPAAPTVTTEPSVPSETVPSTPATVTYVGKADNGLTVRLTMSSDRKVLLSWSIASESVGESVCTLPVFNESWTGDMPLEGNFFTIRVNMPAGAMSPALDFTLTVNDNHMQVAISNGGEVQVECVFTELTLNLTEEAGG